LRFLRQTYGFADVALLIVMGIVAIRASKVDFMRGEQNVFPDLMAAGLPVYHPPHTPQVRTELTELARHESSQSLLALSHSI
jgi:hypothetical protein